MKRKIKIGALIVLPLALFFVLREVNSWRPQKIASGFEFLQIVFSPDGKQVAALSLGGVSLGETSAPKLEKRFKIPGSMPQNATFSRDGKTLWVLAVNNQTLNSKIWRWTIASSRLDAPLSGPFPDSDTIFRLEDNDRELRCEDTV